MQTIPAWFPLLISACLLLIGLVLSMCGNGYLEPHGIVMFYPLAIVIMSSWQVVLQGLIGVSVALLHLLALKRDVDRDYMVGSVLLTSLFVLFVVILASFSPPYSREMIPLQTLSTEDHTYRLVLQHWGNGDPHLSLYVHSIYVVLECDRSGLICGYLVTPAACIEEGALLTQDPTTQRVLMSMGTRIYDVKAIEDGYYATCVIKGLSR